jgi:Helicase associated domain
MWMKCLEQLKEYHETHGTFDVPLDEDSEDGGFLAKWVRVQRAQYKKKQSKVKCDLSKERVKELNAINFDWDGNRDIKF